MLKFYLLWVPATFIYYGIYALIANKSNLTHERFWLIATFICGALCPLWMLVSRYSKDLMFDGLLYDIVILLSYVAAMFYVGRMESFGPLNYFGIFLLVIGMILVKI